MFTSITEGLKNNIPIHIMQKAVGHKNIQSTEHYIRHDLSELEWKRVITATNRERVNGFLIKNDEYNMISFIFFFITISFYFTKFFLCTHFMVFVL